MVGNISFLALVWRLDVTFFKRKVFGKKIKKFCPYSAAFTKYEQGLIILHFFNTPTTVFWVFRSRSAPV